MYEVVINFLTNKEQNKNNLTEFYLTFLPALALEF